MKFSGHFIQDPLPHEGDQKSSPYNLLIQAGLAFYEKDQLILLPAGYRILTKMHTIIRTSLKNLRAEEIGYHQQLPHENFYNLATKCISKESDVPLQLYYNGYHHGMSAFFPSADVLAECKNSILEAYLPFFLSCDLENPAAFIYQEDEKGNHNIRYIDQSGKKHRVEIANIHIDLLHIMNTVIEQHHDDDGVLWPRNIRPFDAHLINIHANSSEFADLAYRTLTAEGFDIIYDDRADVPAAEKFAAADIVGSPVRLVISENTGKNLEWKFRDEKKVRSFDIPEVVAHLNEFYT